MRKPRRRMLELGLSLTLSACSAKPEQITLTPLDPKSRTNSGPASEFDNPDTHQTGLDAAAEGGSQSVADGGFRADSCASGRITAARIPPKVVLVLDGSCSMSTNYPANGAQSASLCTRNPNGRWTALRDALVGSDGVVPKLESAVAFGLVVYGTEPRCPIPGRAVTAQLHNLGPIQAALPEVQPGRNTPTGPALEWVYDNLISNLATGARGAKQIVILATDGEPNSCGALGLDFGLLGGMETNYQPSVDALRRGTMKGATTYVISLADATGPFHDHLQELANIGNPSAKDGAKLYEPASPEQLAQTLEMLSRAAVSCEIVLNGTFLLDHACDGRVTLGGTELGCNDPNGWEALDDRTIRLNGDACEMLKSADDPVIDASFACTGFRPD